MAAAARRKSMAKKKKKKTVSPWPVEYSPGPIERRNPRQPHHTVTGELRITLLQIIRWYIVLYWHLYTYVQKYSFPPESSAYIVILRKRLSANNRFTGRTDPPACHLDFLVFYF